MGSSRNLHPNLLSSCFVYRENQTMGTHFKSHLSKLTAISKPSLSIFHVALFQHQNQTSYNPPRFILLSYYLSFSQHSINLRRSRLMFGSKKSSAMSMTIMPYHKIAHTSRNAIPPTTTKTSYLSPHHNQPTTFPPSIMDIHPDIYLYLYQVAKFSSLSVSQLLNWPSDSCIVIQLNLAEIQALLYRTQPLEQEKCWCLWDFNPITTGFQQKIAEMRKDNMQKLSLSHTNPTIYSPLQTLPSLVDYKPYNPCNFMPSSNHRAHIATFTPPF